MMRFLSSLVLAFTCFFKDSTATNVPNSMYMSLSPSDVDDVKAFNPDNDDGLTFGFEDEYTVASHTINMEHHVMRQAESVLYEHTFGTNLDTLEYFNSISETELFIHLTYLPNEERLLESTGITLTASGTSTPPTDTPVKEVIGTTGNCSYKAFSFQTSITSKYLDIVQFAVYTNSSGITANSITRNRRTIVSNLLSTISVSHHPSFVVVGTLLLQSTGTGALNETQTEGIMNILAASACDQLDAVQCNDCNCTNKVDCHPEPGATESGCVAKGCLWCEDPTDPWCFFASGVCINGGMPSTPSNSSGCVCTSPYFGKICGILCDNGMIKNVPPGDREVCECDFGWGQDGCVEESPVAHFITQARKSAKTCQNLVTRHEEYLYLMLNSTQIGVDPLLGGVVHETIEQTRYSVGNINKTFEFDEFIKEPSFHATMDRTNDLLAAIYIPASSPVSDRISIELTTTYRTRSTTEEASNGSSGKIGFCSYEYRVVQRFKAGVEQAAAKLFFVAGVQDISTMPTNTSLISQFGAPSDEIIDTWNVDGTSMQNIIFGFTVIGRDEPGKIPYEQLDAVAKCYALEACRSLPIECAPGEQVDSPQGPMCECPSNVTGIQCDLPLC